MLARGWKFDSIRNGFSASAMSHFEIGGGKRIYQHLYGQIIVIVRFATNHDFDPSPSRFPEFFWLSVQHSYVLGLPPYASFPT